MTHYFSFKVSSLPTLEQVGGKGLSLIYLNKKGFNVPSALVLSNEFFQPWMEILKSTSAWQVNLLKEKNPVYRGL
jgi:phosphoenolpyruvate synthase/pyruvate phosphate dikinase